MTGLLRTIGPSDFASVGVQPEQFEELRQTGRIWIIDATGDDSDCTPLGAATTSDFWGGLYASGHLEIVSGELSVDMLIELIRSKLVEAKFEPSVVPNKAGRKEILKFDRGFRICCDTQSPCFFSLHMDANIGCDFVKSRSRFDSICKNLMTGLSSLCDSESVKLINKFDLDFSYSNSLDSMTVLRSKSAELIHDPLLMAVRDCHRKRSET